MTGIDKVISSLKQTFELDLWNDANTKYYGKSFRNRVALDTGKMKIVAEIFNETTQDYEEVMFDDTLDALCFFDLGDTIEGLSLGNQSTREVRIIFSVNLKTINGNSKRDTEAVYNDVLQLLREYHAMEFDLKRIEVGKRAYGNLDTSRLIHYDIHPFHSFALVGTAKLFYNNC